MVLKKGAPLTKIKLFVYNTTLVRLTQNDLVITLLYINIVFGFILKWNDKVKF